MGCYTDSTSNRTLANNVQTDEGDDVTVENCLDACSINGYGFCGMEFSSQCWGGAQLMGGEQLAQEGCTYKCKGNPVEICGGSNRLSLYQAVDDGCGGCSAMTTSHQTVITTMQPSQATLASSISVSIHSAVSDPASSISTSIATAIVPASSTISQPSASPTKPPSSQHDTKFPIWATILIVILVVLLIPAVLLLCIWYSKRRNSDQFDVEYNRRFPNGPHFPNFSGTHFQEGEGVDAAQGNREGQHLNDLSDAETRVATPQSVPAGPSPQRSIDEISAIGDDNYMMSPELRSHQGLDNPQSDNGDGLTPQQHANSISPLRPHYNHVDETTLSIYSQPDAGWI